MKVLKVIKPKQRRRDDGFRKFTMKFRKVLHNGLFVNLPMYTRLEKENEARVKLWRAVIDQHLKDIISHHMVTRNFFEYYDARIFIDEQLNDVGEECSLAFLDPRSCTQNFYEV